MNRDGDIMSKGKKNQEISGAEQQSGQQPEYPCSECNAFFKDPQALGGHMKNTHGKGSKSHDDLNIGDTQEDSFKNILRNVGVKDGIATIVAQMFFAKDPEDLEDMNDTMKTAGISPNKRKLAIKSWAIQMGLDIPDGMLNEFERDRDKKEVEKDEAVFDMSFMKKQLKQMFEMQQYQTMLDFFKQNTQMQKQQPSYPIGSPSSNTMPYIDPKTGELKTMEIKGGTDPMMLYMLLGMNKEHKEDFFESLIKYKTAMDKIAPPQPGGDKINDLRLELVKSNAARDRESVEEKAKFQNAMNDFKHILEKSKMETEFNTKLDKITEQLNNAHHAGDLQTEMEKYAQIKKMLQTFAETEGRKPGESGVNWTELIGKTLQTMDGYFANQSRMTQPSVIVPMQLPPQNLTEEQLKEELQRQQEEKYPSFEDNFVGVTYHPPGTDINKQNQNITDANFNYHDLAEKNLKQYDAKSRENQQNQNSDDKNTNTGSSE